MAILFILGYLAIGILCMGIFPDSAGKPFGGMIVLWIIIVPILGLGWFLNLLYELGEKVGKRFRR